MKKMPRQFRLCSAFLLSWLCFSFCPAQTQHCIGLSGGWHHSRISDHKLSPLIYTGVTLAGELNYQNRSDKRWHQAALYHSGGNLEPAASNNLIQGSHTMAVQLAQVEHCLLWPLRWTLPGNTGAHFGYHWHFTAHRRRLTYLGSVEENNFEAFTGFGPALAVEYPLKERHRFSWRLSAVLFTFAARYGYSPKRFHQDGIFQTDNLEWWGSFPDIQSRLGYQFQPGPRWAFSVDYYFRYYRYKTNVSTSVAFQRLSVGFAYKFPKI